MIAGFVKKQSLLIGACITVQKIMAAKEILVLNQKFQYIIFHAKDIKEKNSFFVNFLKIKVDNQVCLCYYVYAWWLFNNLRERTLTRKDIIDAFCRIREIDNTIPDEVLDFMKECALREIDNMNG